MWIPTMIDTEAIPRTDTQSLAQTVLESVKHFYDNPENEKRFEVWKENREKQRRLTSKC